MSQTYILYNWYMAQAVVSVYMSCTSISFIFMFMCVSAVSAFTPAIDHVMDLEQYACPHAFTPNMLTQSLRSIPDWQRLILISVGWEIFVRNKFSFYSFGKQP